MSRETKAQRRSLSVLAPAKPPEGVQCNGCGICCTAELCRTGREVFDNAPAPCPGLAFRDGRFWCSLVETAEEIGHGGFIRWQLGIGVGCDSDAPAGMRLFAPGEAVPA